MRIRDIPQCTQHFLQRGSQQSCSWSACSVVGSDMLRPEAWNAPAARGSQMSVAWISDPASNSTPQHCGAFRHGIELLLRGALLSAHRPAPAQAIAARRFQHWYSVFRAQIRFSF
jgi:hypothetical protein